MNENVNINKYLLEYLNIKIPFIISCLLLFVYPLQKIYLPQYYGKVIANLNNNKNKFINDIKILIFIFVVIQLLNSLSHKVQGLLIPDFLYFVTDKIISFLLNINELDYDNIEIGKILSKISKLPGVGYKYLDLLKSLIFSQLIIFLTSIYHYYKISLETAFWFIFIVIGLFILQYLCYKTLVDLEIKREKQRDIFVEFLKDIINNFISIITSNKQTDEKNNIKKSIKPFIDTFYKLLNVNLIMNIIFSLFNIFSFILLNYFINKNFLNKNISREQFISSFIVTYSILSLFSEINNSFKQFTDIRSKVLDIELFFNKKNKLNNKNNEKNLFLNGNIVFKNVFYKYNKDNDISVLDNINININKNENVAIIGDTGSGKTTLIKLLLKFISPTNGEILINNININKISKKELYNYIFYIPQKPKLLNRTLYENFIYGLDNNNNKYDFIKKILNILKEIGIQNSLIETFSKKMNTFVGNEGSKLSGGQRQIVWIVRAILKDTKIIILDEPTASLDKKNKYNIINILNRIGKDKTVIIITHDEINNNFRKINIENGKIVNNNFNTEEYLPLHHY